MATATTKKRSKKRAAKSSTKSARAPKKASAKTQAPKSRDAASRPEGPGSFCWNELMTSDVKSARGFYGSLLGWKAQDMDMGPMGTYTLWLRGKERVGGCMALPPGLAQSGAPPHWMAYVEVTDVDSTAKKATSLGGKLFHGPADIPGIGRFAVLADPQGAEICVFKPAPM